jgi:DNA repair protein RecO (recombination protein O)
MGQTYKATGINLKRMPLGETDCLIAILTPEFGIRRAVAPGARKPKSRLRGRTEPFVVNELLMAKGRSLDKIVQAETLESYPGLSRDLGKLTVSQYLAELILAVGLSDQAQTELYDVFNEHLRRISQILEVSPAPLLSHLAHGIFHILALAGLAPQVHRCCLTGRSLVTNLSDPHWRIQFSFEAGGAIAADADGGKIATAAPRADRYLNGVELMLMQQLAAADLPAIAPEELILNTPWLRIERILRDYAQYHLDKTIRSATLLDTLYVTDF